MYYIILIYKATLQFDVLSLWIIIIMVINPFRSELENKCIRSLNHKIMIDIESYGLIFTAMDYMYCALFDKNKYNKFT